MSHAISSTPPVFPSPSQSAAGSGTPASGGSATSSPAAIAQTGDSITLSDDGQFRALCERSGLKVSGGTLGQLFSPAFFVRADTDNSGRLSAAEFTSFIEQNGGNALQAAGLYHAMGGNDKGLTYAQFRAGVGQDEAKDFFNQLVMTRVKGSGTDPHQWLQQLAALGEESSLASETIAKEAGG